MPIYVVINIKTARHVNYGNRLLLFREIREDTRKKVIVDGMGLNVYFSFVPNY